MAVDKLVDSSQLDSDLTSVANAIRTKGGTSAQLSFPSGFVSAVQAIPTGSGGPQTFTLVSDVDGDCVACYDAIQAAIGSTNPCWVMWTDDVSYATSNAGQKCVAGVGTNAPAQTSIYRNDSGTYKYMRRFAGNSTNSCKMTAGVVFKYFVITDYLGE